MRGIEATDFQVAREQDMGEDCTDGALSISAGDMDDGESVLGGSEGGEQLGYAEHSGKAPTFASIYKLFGPVYPGYYEKNSYYLNYPGVTFIFPLPATHTPAKQKSEELPIFPDGVSPVLSRLYVFSGSSRWEGAIPVSINPDDVKEITIELGKGITVTTGASTKPLAFGTTPQQVLMDFGHPQQKMFKPKENLQIHNSIDSDTIGEDYLWNYYRSSFTLHFSPSHTLRKISLHTNFPSHPNFHRYHRTIISLSYKSTKIDCLGKWDDVKKVLGMADGPPVVFDRSMLGGMLGQNGRDGSTLFYGYNDLGIIFEVMKNG
ncbi:hypothetical protein HK098_002107, partial [Nowakowskiella sp. JEL0407]